MGLQEDIIWGYSYLKTLLRLEDLRPSSLAWLLAGGLSSWPCGTLYGAASRHGSQFLLE